MFTHLSVSILLLIIWVGLTVQAFPLCKNQKKQARFLDDNTNIIIEHFHKKIAYVIVDILVTSYAERDCKIKRVFCYLSSKGFLIFELSNLKRVPKFNFPPFSTYFVTSNLAEFNFNLIFGRFSRKAAINWLFFFNLSFNTVDGNYNFPMTGFDCSTTN